MSLIRIALALTVGVLGGHASGQSPPVDWPSDARALVRLLRTEHAAPFWLRDRETFARVERELIETADGGASDEQVLAQMLRLIATIGDGHTVLAGPDRYARFGIAPFFAELYDDGVFLVRVPATRRSLLAAEIVGVGNVTIEDALDRLRNVVPHSTESRFRRWARSYLHLPGLIHALGLTDRSDEVELTLRTRDGTIVRETFRRYDADEYDTLEMARLERPPLLRSRNPDASYWFETLPDRAAVYFNFRRTESRGPENVWAFGARMTAELKAGDVTRLIIDLRENGGGGYQFAAHLRPLIRTVPLLDRRGGVLVLTGPYTYSAASDFLSQLERHTDAILIGQVPGGSIGEPGDDDDFELPSSGVTVRISQVAGRSSATVDARRPVRPHVIVPRRFADVLAGRDPALEAALTYRPAPVPTVEPASGWAGRYACRADADLVIRRVDGRWRAVVLPFVDTPLVALGPKRFGATLSGVTLMLDEDRDGVQLIRADGSRRFCPRKVDDSPAAWDLVFRGRVEEAAPLLKQAFVLDPDAPSLADGTFSSEAIHLSFTLRDSIGADAARQAARQLLLTAIDLLPDGAPECEFSLRFYPEADTE